MIVDQFIDILFNITSYKYSPTPPRDESKGKGIATKENPIKDLIPLIEEGGLAPQMLNLNQFSTSRIQMSPEEAKASTGIEGLVECKASASNLKHIHVKDIVKEVEDYLKTYSLAEMDINWCVEGIRCGFKERPVSRNQIARRVFNDLVDFSGETSVARCFPDPGEVFDTLMCLRDDVRDEQARVDALNDCIARAQEQIEIKEEHVRVMEAEDNDGPYFLLDKLLEVTGSPRLDAQMKYVFGHSRSKDESLGSLMRSLCSGLRVSLSNKRRLVAELEALGESEGAAKCLEHMRVIFGRDAVTLGELEALLAHMLRLGRL
ncbi:hypothetical protein Tco_1043586 [Tanacetum coccineum]|uniref:Uncharacterized protein n=1 Tax=Tanacetum coccineum TaxID=301880 RepID=A0ABQ5GMG5_9ASTR